jgi:hypothetical protein
MKDESAIVRYIYVSRAYMSKPHFLGMFPCLDMVLQLAFW